MVLMVAGDIVGSGEFHRSECSGSTKIATENIEIGKTYIHINGMKVLTMYRDGTKVWYKDLASTSVASIDDQNVKYFTLVSNGVPAGRVE